MKSISTRAAGSVLSFSRLNIALLACAVLASTPAQAAKAPNPLVTDSRVKQVAYDPNQVYEIVGTYGYQTVIEFAPDELVKVAALGDSIAWQNVPHQNRLFLKPVEPNAATNLTVITDKRTYFFKLSSPDQRKGQDSMTFLVRFVYPNAQSTMAANASTSPAGPAAKPPGIGIDPAKLNLEYGTSGDKRAIPLKRAFDDGQFTYFLFEEGSEIPSVYTVGPDGTESVVNTRREGAYLVVERTASLFTLRNGKAYLCVQNGSAPFKRVINESATRG